MTENEIYGKLREAEQEARMTNQRYSHKEVMTELRKQLTAIADAPRQN